MKSRKITVLFLALSTLIVFSASKPKKVKLDSNFKEVSHRFYASAYEVTNKEYRLYLSDLKQHNQLEEYQRNLPDTAQWVKAFPNSFNQPFCEKYFWHPGFDQYPVVNVSKEAASDYCKWLTNKYDSQEKPKFKKVTFRLPTEQEWNKMASVLPGHNLPWYGNFAYEPNDNKFCANVKFEDKLSEGENYDYTLDGALTTMLVGNYKPNKLGLYDIIGNVAELTSTGVIKGGSWFNTIEECVVNKTQNFNAPDPRVGFRVVMMIEEF
ncbi:formylglycine-generating enzyme family protein [Plebeiibacterium sediminum]|uniref:Formylglycine-generating enzyme family protein n=1 Tax=Plebeiibacterium sediminum TaxID=2992112 RepID=A0AAE3SHJ5_9BACT|nr:SUMF1/EgtB/PvdO family nonheme iron enzyme [Plebeiobacterium sediminum]MCW3789585.1 formylglycine-generating enzyme family protein [Plebeiobacterium sediminum]